MSKSLYVGAMVALGLFSAGAAAFSAFMYFEVQMLKSQIDRDRSEFLAVYDAAISNPTYESIKIKSPKSKASIEIGFNDEEKFYQNFYDKDGMKRIFIGISDNIKPRIRLYDKNEQTRISISGPSDDEKLSQFYGFSAVNGNNKVKINLIANNKNNYNGLYLYPDYSDSARVMMQIKDDEGAGYSYYDKEGKLSIYMGGNSKGSGSYVYDRHGYLRLAMGVNSKNTVYKELFKKDNSVAFGVSTDEQNNFKNVIYRTDSEKAWNFVSTASTLYSIYQAASGDGK